MNNVHLKSIESNEEKCAIMECYVLLFKSFMSTTDASKFYGSQPVSMMPESLLYVTQRRESDGEFLYNVTPKLDGTRMLMLCHPMLKKIIFIDRCLNFYESMSTYTYNNSTTCMFDGEFFMDVFFVFDILYYNGFICSYIFDVRLETFQQLIVSNRDRFTDTVISHFTKCTGIRIVPKLYMELSGFNKSLDHNSFDLYTFITTYFTNYALNKELNLIFIFDGLIFTPRFTRYILTGNWKYPFNILFKWKPVERESIDFVLNNNIGRKIISKYMLGCVDTYKSRVVFQTDKRNKKFAIIDNPNHFKLKIDGATVYECVFNTKTEHFDIIREREDKYDRPNSLRTALSVLKLIQLKLNINEIITCINGSAIPVENTQIPQWQRNSYELKNIIEPIDSVISRFNNQNGNRGVFNEFEIRIGRYNYPFYDTEIQQKHFNWFVQTLESLQIPFVNSETIDYFDDNGFRYCLEKKTCIKKYQQDIKNFIVADTFGYDFRVSVATEESFSNIHFDKKTNYRKKKRKTFNYNKNFNIDTTIFYTSKSPEVARFQIEIELKTFRNIIDSDELNTVILFVLRNLNGRSEIL